MTKWFVSSLCITFEFARECSSVAGVSQCATLSVFGWLMRVCWYLRTCSDFE